MGKREIVSLTTVCNTRNGNFWKLLEEYFKKAEPSEIKGLRDKYVQVVEAFEEENIERPPVRVISVKNRLISQGVFSCESQAQNEFYIYCLASGEEPVSLISLIRNLCLQTTTKKPASYDYALPFGRVVFSSHHEHVS